MVAKWASKFRYFYHQDNICGFVWLYLKFKSLAAYGWVGRLVPDINATSGPQLADEADFSSVKFVSWGQVWKKYMHLTSFFLQQCFLLLSLLLDDRAGSYPQSKSKVSNKTIHFFKS